MISSRDLNKVLYFHEHERVVLNNVNVDIKEGEFVALIGASGSGKRMLLKLIGLFDQLTSGQLVVMGTDVSGFNEREMDQYRRGRIGWLFREINLIDSYSVFENIELPLIYLGFSRKKRRELVGGVMRELNLFHRKASLSAHLDVFQKQVVALARSIVFNPPIIVADDPTGCMNTMESELFMQLLVQQHESGRTIVLSSHSELVGEKAGRIVRMVDGHLV